jgi:hypothetical protein
MGQKNYSGSEPKAHGFTVVAKVAFRHVRLPLSPIPRVMYPVHAAPNQQLLFSRWSLTGLEGAG